MTKYLLVGITITLLLSGCALRHAARPAAKTLVKQAPAETVKVAPIAPLIDTGQFAGRHGSGDNVLTQNPFGEQRQGTPQAFSSRVEAEKTTLSPMAYVTQGQTYSNQGQHEKAIQLYDKAIQLDPNLAKAYFNRALAYFALRTYPRAIDDYSDAARLNPSYAEAYYGRGLALEATGRLTRARVDYKLACELHRQFC